jgi:hypothetical protein
MAIRNDFAPGEVLAAADLNDTFGSKLDAASQRIVQIVRATDSTQRTTTSASYVDASLSVTITPTKNTNVVLVIYVGNVFATRGTTGTPTTLLRITDSSNNAISGSEEMQIAAANTTFVTQSTTLIAYSTPATEAATTYKLRFRSINTDTTSRLENNVNTGQLYAIEVSA